jgi:hypothetical protein
MNVIIRARAISFYSPPARLHLQLRPPQFGVTSGSVACSSTTAAPHEFFGHYGGYPWSTLAGAALILAILITSAFTQEFRMTLVSGVPFLVLLSAIFLMRNRPVQTASGPVPESSLDEVQL